MSTDKFNPQKLTHSALLRFAYAVDAVMEAEYITTRQRMDLISCWAYQYDRRDMPEQLAAAIKRCQGNPDDLIVSPTCIINAVTGEQVPFHPES